MVRKLNVEIYIQCKKKSPSLNWHPSMFPSHPVWTKNCIMVSLHHCVIQMESVYIFVFWMHKPANPLCSYDAHCMCPMLPTIIQIGFYDSTDACVQILFSYYGNLNTVTHI